MLGPWETLGEEVPFENRWVRVRLQQVRLPTGQEYEYTIVDRPAQGVAVFLFDRQGRLLLEREYRHAIGQVMWQLPGGLIDGDEPPLQSAIRELREETGYTATDWIQLGEFYDNPGLGNARSILFAAKVAVEGDGESMPAPPEWDESEAIEMEWVTAEWLRGAIERGEITERVVLCGVAMLWARGLL